MASREGGSEKLYQQKAPVQEPTPSETHKGIPDPSSSNPAGPPPPPECMATRWTKTWRSLFRCSRAAPTKQTPPETYLMLLPPPIQEKKQSSSRKPANPQQQRTSTPTDGPGRSNGSKRSRHEILAASNASPADNPSRRRRPHRHTKATS